MASVADLSIPFATAAPWSRPRSLWMNTTCVVLLAYAVIGKGAAYLGVPPVFIGELVLAGGIAALASSARLRGTRFSLQLWCVAALAAWGLACTLPYLSTYGIDSLRDAVIWGYGAFAFVWFRYLLADVRRLPDLWRNYERFAVVALVGMPVAWLARFVMGDATPRWPWADIPVIELRAGDVLVHLAGIFAFWVARPKATVGWPSLGMLALVAGVLGAYERAGLLAFAAVFALCAMFRPRHPAIRGLVVAGVATITVLAISGVKLQMPVTETTKVREISFEQFVANVQSVLFPSDMGDLEDTKEWRLEWWGEIASYTLKGRYFWTGKGFGINLADDDGFQVMDDHSLRSPHNGHLMILARAGVPGLLLWGLVQATWGAAIGSALLRSIRAGAERWAGVFLFLLAYWMAFLINASFDVFLEGPLGGIWFWSIYGVGLAALWVWKNHTQVWSEYENPRRA